MNTDTLILPFVASGGIWILLIGILLLLYKTSCNLLQRILILTAATWCGYGIWFLVRHYLLGYSFDNKLFAFNRVSWGVLMALATVLYPITAICREWLQGVLFRLFIGVPLVILLIYFVLWLITGQGFEEYSTYAQLAEGLHSPFLWLRIVLWLISISYHLIALYLIAGVAPVYENYIKNTYSDLQYNLRWIRVIAAFFIGNIIVHTLNIFWFEAWTRMVFMMVNFPLWIFMLDQAIFGKCFTPAQEFHIRWSWKKGWHEVYLFTDDTDHNSCIQTSYPTNPDQQYTDKRNALYSTLWTRMEQFMLNEKPYMDRGLTRETFVQSLNTNRTTLVTVLRLNGYDNFQDYINSHRIRHFKQLAVQEPQSSIVSLYTHSGFSSRSTFIRYFKEREGMLPGEYMQGLEK